MQKIFILFILFISFSFQQKVFFNRFNKIQSKAPEKFKVLFHTSAVNFTLKVVRDWSPNGVSAEKYYENSGFFRVIRGFVAQFGIEGDPIISARWRFRTIKDDPVKVSNTRGRVAVAMTNLKNSRTTQLYINYANNGRLDLMGFAPFGEIDEEGMKVADKIYSGYGESPIQDMIYKDGNKYLKKNFPNMDYIYSVKVLE